MRKTREILRLHFLGLKQRQIARSCSLAQSTVNACLQTAKAAGVTWPEVADWDYLKLESALFGEPPSAVARRQKPAPDFAVIERELQSHEHLTLQLLWEEKNPPCSRAERVMFSRLRGRAYIDLSEEMCDCRKQTPCRSC
jgi:hypothetical protein